MVPQESPKRDEGTQQGFPLELKVLMAVFVLGLSLLLLDVVGVIEFF